MTKSRGLEFAVPWKEAFIYVLSNISGAEKYC
jgi:hypothetical protein